VEHKRWDRDYTTALDYGVRYRFQILRNGKEITGFVIQLEVCDEKLGWVPLVRYDTAPSHGYPHRDEYKYARGQEKRQIDLESFLIEG